MSAKSSPNTNSSPRREPPKSPTPPANNIGYVAGQMNNVGINAYNSWYSLMISEWAWIIYTVILLFLLIAGVFIYNTYMYPSKSSSTFEGINTPSPPISKIDPV